MFALAFLLRLSTSILCTPWYQWVQRSQMQSSPKKKVFLPYQEMFPSLQQIWKHWKFNKKIESLFKLCFFSYFLGLSKVHRSRRNRCQTVTYLIEPFRDPNFFLFFLFSFSFFFHPEKKVQLCIIHPPFRWLQSAILSCKIIHDCNSLLHIYFWSCLKLQKNLLRHSFTWRSVDLVSSKYLS